ncbi:MAG: RluA family pseudouridine synthase [Deltaproteobacteria bacterium]|nr:RluA family pseudouridine synthase [Deltaproteobacteria bacterium]
MNPNIVLRVNSRDSLKRLDVFLSQKKTLLSRTQIKRLIEKGNVQVGGRKVKAGMRLKENDVVTLTLPKPQKLETQAEPIPLTILYEDRHLIVVDKPAGMVVHPAAGNFSGTLVNALLHYCTDLSGIGGVLRPGIVHRLDKDTSGVLVVAKEDFTHRALSAQFKEHTPLRKYVGIVFGQIPDEGQSEAIIGRHPTHRQKMSVRPRKGREARTHWQVLERYHHFCLAEFRLQTGRTHQIRVHLSSLGHPILGDPLYGGRKRLVAIEPLLLRQGLQKLRRQALHAGALGFVHPVTGEKLIFSSPLPADIEEAIALLKKLDGAGDFFSQREEWGGQKSEGIDPF